MNLPPLFSYFYFIYFLYINLLFIFYRVELWREPSKSLGISIVGGRGMGSRLSNGEVMRGIFIKHVLEDSPAGKNGTLKPGDRIVEVPSTELSELKLSPSSMPFTKEIITITLLLDQTLEKNVSAVNAFLICFFPPIIAPFRIWWQTDVWRYNLPILKTLALR